VVRWEPLSAEIRVKGTTLLNVLAAIQKVERDRRA
jgi:hypothetical protein